MLRSLTQHTLCQLSRSSINQMDKAILGAMYRPELSSQDDGINTASHHFLVVGGDNQSPVPDSEARHYNDGACPSMA